MAAGSGLDGITNAMVSAIWALDLMLESAKFGLTGVLFNVDLTNGSLQGPFGPAPDYTPRPIYYALLLMSIIQKDAGTRLLAPTVTSAASPNIKVHGLLSGSYVGLVLLNKDTNPSASGTVFVNSSGNVAMTCIYL
jgi:hypothetical protein